MVRTSLIVAVALALGLPATAQIRGTVELGGFASHTAFDDGPGIDDSFGGGGRIGAFLFPRLSVEFEAAGSRAGRTLGRQDVKIGIFAARVTGVPLEIGPLSLLLGAGFEHTDRHFLETGGEHGRGTAHGQGYGLQGLAGVKLSLTDNLALRADWVEAFPANDGDRSRNLQLGLSFYRNPSTRTGTVTNTVHLPRITVAPPEFQRVDSVSAAETRRLRAAEASLFALRDSVATAEALRRTSAGGPATTAERIHFAHDQSELDGSARSILRDKISIFRADPRMRIVIIGYASEPGTDRYNERLGLSRAEAAKAYLISQGVDASRIEIATRGSELLIEGPGEAANAANRRGEFRVQISQEGPPSGG